MTLHKRRPVRRAPARRAPTVALGFALVALTGCARAAAQAAEPSVAARMSSTTVQPIAPTEAPTSTARPTPPFDTGGETIQRARGTTVAAPATNSPIVAGSTIPGSITGPSTSAEATTAATATHESTPESARESAPADKCIAALPVAWRAAQTLMPSVYGDDIAAARVSIEQFGVGGAIVMTWPAGADAAQLVGLKNSVSPPLMLATDEEGGSVQRFRSLGVLPSQHEVASTLSPDAAQHLVENHAKQLAALGIDVVFGPVVDVGDGNGPIGDRAFADDQNTVTTYAGAYIRGWQSAGIMPVIKHFPGHGHASADTHTAAASTPPLSSMRPVDIVPFERLSNDGVGVMVGHLIVPGLTAGEPASVSEVAVTGLLRNQLGYGDALIFSDGLEMEAVVADRSPAQAGVAALQAGVDVLVFIDHANIGPMVESITAAVTSGALAESRLNEAVGRILHTKGVDACTVDVAGRQGENAGE